MKKFEFTDVGKQMPYTVPDRFFELSAERALRHDSRRRKFGRIYKLYAPVAATIAAAAIMAGLFFGPAVTAEPPTDFDAFLTSLSDDEIRALDNSVSDDYFLTANFY